MVSKNNRKLIDEKNRDEKQRFSIRKLSVGAASVLVGLAFSVYSSQQVFADKVNPSDATKTVMNVEGSSETTGEALNRVANTEQSAPQENKEKEAPTSGTDEKSAEIKGDTDANKSAEKQMVESIDEHQDKDSSAKKNDKQATTKAAENASEKQNGG